jgi:acetylornithine deacetylase/succinyl-diaminopimelate desuccinylase-like protein
MIAADVRTETSRLLAELIRIDTSNPPGNETAAAEHLAAYLAEAGVKSELVGREPHRASLIARLPGTGDGPSLMLLGHTDVVGADADEWSVPPFSGLERDGFVWGRGALDMKGQVAAEAVAVATLAREGWRGAGDLILCAVADEEVGEDWGLSWLVQEHPDLVRADYVLNEGGGERIEHRGRVAYTVGVGEKRCAAFAVTVHGKSGHASTPGAADNALVKLGPVIDRIQRMPRPTAKLAALADFLAAVGEDGADPAELVGRCRNRLRPCRTCAFGPPVGNRRRSPASDRVERPRHRARSRLRPCRRCGHFARPRRNNGSVAPAHQL